MSDGFPGRPKILRGAFVEFGLSLPPLLVVFQFNPLQLTRGRTLGFAVPGGSGDGKGRSLRDFHAETASLTEVQEQQQVTVQEQTISFDIRLDATDLLGEGDAVTERFGLSPQLATLELMTRPKSESLLGAAADLLLGKPEKGFSFTRGPNPPLVLFVFGRKRVLPVNITAMNITETEFTPDLEPVRATVGVSLTVIEGKSPPYRYTQAMAEAMSVLNLAHAGDVTNVVLPE